MQKLLNIFYIPHVLFYLTALEIEHKIFYILNIKRKICIVLLTVLFEFLK